MQVRNLIGLERDGDLRVLKAQLDVAAHSLLATRFTAPLWALLMALGVTGLFGHRPLAATLLLPVLVLGTAIFSSLVTEKHRHSMDMPPDETLRRWFVKLSLVQLSRSVAWGLLPWLLWEPGNPLNHLFLAVCVMMVISGVMVARGSSMGMFVVSVIPVAASATLRFALGDGAMDMAMAAAAPLFALQMAVARRPLLTRMRQDARLRFQVEDLARELEETRDDALKKRFEAEAANASKTAFLANMSHELRTPLNAILGFSEIICEECFGAVGNARYRDYARDIHSSGAHLLSLINDLLDIAKIEAGQMEISPHPLDPKRSFESALKLVGYKAAERGQELVILVDAGAPALHADERALKQILINLVSNAVKFTPEGGRIEVVGSKARDGGFQILVKDNGPGIARDKLDTVFMPFAQVDNRYDRKSGGTGLGLALVRGLAELHGGRAWIESVPGEGACAYVVLPSRAARAVAAA